MRRAVSSSKPPRPLSSYVYEEGSLGGQGDDEPNGGEKGLKGKRSHSSMDSHLPHETTPTSQYSGVYVSLCVRGYMCECVGMYGITVLLLRHYIYVVSYFSLSR